MWSLKTAHIIFLFREFCKPSPINTSYFHLLTVGFLLDFPACICWGIGQFTSLEEVSLITEIYSIEQWHNMFLVGVMDVIIALNRFTAIAMPRHFELIWRPLNVVFCLLLVLILPFIFDFMSLFDLDCLLHMFAKPRCSGFMKAFYFKAIIVNVAFGLLASILAFAGIRKYKSMTSNTVNRSLERRFLDQTLTGAVLIVLYYSAYVYFLFQEVTNENYIIVDTIVTVCYIVQHYVPMFMLFFISLKLRRRFCNFYHICPFRKSQTQPKSTAFSKVTPTIH
uniref:Serpentine Receptor, class T n=2 Tax=Panagrellus redivivus TaxID=6233 RepID=A0A7E4UPF1_PANRE